MKEETTSNPDLLGVKGAFKIIQQQKKYGLRYISEIEINLYIKITPPAVVQTLGPFKIIMK